MKLSDVGKTGKYKVISKYAVYIYTPEEIKFLTSLLNKEYHLMTDTEVEIKQDLSTKKGVCRKSLYDYHYRYWMNTCETILFGDSGIDCSTIDLETRIFFWKNFPILDYHQRREIENYDTKVSYEEVGNLNGYYKESVKDMFDLFSLLYYTENEYYRNLGRNPKFISVEELKDNHKHIEVLNMKWWNEDMPGDINIRGRFNKQLTN